jgi:hypothetical protein
MGGTYEAQTPLIPVIVIPFRFAFVQKMNIKAHVRDLRHISGTHPCEFKYALEIILLKIEITTGSGVCDSD